MFYKNIVEGCELRSCMGAEGLPRDRRRIAEGSWGDNAKNQHFMHFVWHFVYRGGFQ